MQIKETQIAGYRGFTTPQTLRLARPNGEPGSGLTVLVGPNNGGKSSVLEVLSYLRAPTSDLTFDDQQRNAARNARVEITYDTDKGRIHLRSLATGAGEMVLPEGFQRGKVWYLPAKRWMEEQFTASNPGDRASYVQRAYDHTSRRMQTMGIGQRLTAIADNPETFDRILSQILIDPPKWFLAKQASGSHSARVSTAPSQHGFEGLGQGVLNAIMIADALHDAQPGDIVLIDEPELAMAPSAQRRLLRILASKSARTQIVIATHSPYFGPIEYLANGATLARVYLHDRHSTIAQMSKQTSDALTSIANDSHNPHTLGLDAREVFFLEDGVILVEGQEDVIGYRTAAEYLEIEIAGHFFGWGVGGASKMTTVASLLDDLGFERVVGVLDGNRKKDVKALQLKFLKYSFLTIKADDVRSKAETKARPAVAGLLTTAFKVRPGTEGDLIDLFATINKLIA
jgi:ABC-type Mn2+/Zn2+ transport system ATPase subunit